MIGFAIAVLILILLGVGYGIYYLVSSWMT